MEKIGPTNIWIVSPEGSSLGKKRVNDYWEESLAINM